MQTSPFSFKKIIWQLPSVITIFALLSISSCKGKNDKEGGKENLASSCLTLTADTINKYWAPKYTNPSNPAKDIITVLKFYPSYDPKSGGYKLSVQAFNNVDIKLGNEFNLDAGIACAVNLPSLVTGRSNDLDLGSLNIFKGDGSLVANFSKIILTPAVENVSGFNFLKFDVAVVIGDSRTQAASILPCPPCINCKPPCPVNCSPACTKEDSTRLGIPPYNIMGGTDSTK